MKTFSCVPVTIVALLLSGCAYGVEGGRVGETGEVQVLDNTSLPEPVAADTIGRTPIIGPQDTLVIDVFNIEALTNREINVDLGGNISLPLTGTIMAAGRTPEQLAAQITERLRTNYVREPRVSVNVKEARSQIVTVDGQVGQPGRYPVIGDMTLLDAVASAHGASEFAQLDDVVVLRTVNGKRYAGVYNIAAIRRGNYEDPQVYARDVIIVGDSVARRRFKDILTLLPAVTSPLIYLLDNN